MMFPDHHYYQLCEAMMAFDGQVNHEKGGAIL
jgi:hypothetical protein